MMKLWISDSEITVLMAQGPTRTLIDSSAFPPQEQQISRHKRVCLAASVSSILQLCSFHCVWLQTRESFNSFKEKCFKICSTLAITLGQN